MLLANPEWIDNNPATAAELKAAGVQTRYLYAAELHAKLVIADGVALVGSENMSFNSLENNREVGMPCDRARARPRPSSPSSNRTGLSASQPLSLGTQPVAAKACCGMVRQCGQSAHTVDPHGLTCRSR